MASAFSKASLMLLTIATAVACSDESLSPIVGGEASNALTAGSLEAPAAVRGSPQDHLAMQEIVDTFDEAWTAGDPVTYAEQYAGAEWVGPTGVILTDPAAITAVYTGILTFGLPGTTRQSAIRNLTFLTGTIAVLDIDARVTDLPPLPPGLVPWQPGILRALEKNILLKRGGEWRIVQHQQTFVAPQN
jgi:hypothetical protein